MSNKKKFEPVPLYSRDGMTMYKVNKHPVIVKIFNASIKICVELAKAQQLPHKVFVKEEDLKMLNQTIFGKERTRIVEVFMSPHNNAPAIIKIEDIQWASKEEHLYELHKEESTPVKPKPKKKK